MADVIDIDSNIATGNSTPEKQLPDNPGLAERFRRWRTRTIARPGFRRFAQRFPLTRPVANRHANALYALTAGFVFTQTLKSCVELGILDRLAASPATLRDLSSQTAIAADRLERLLRAARAHDIVHRNRHGLWSLGDTGAVVESNPGIRALIDHHGDLYDDIRDLTGLLRAPDQATKTARYWSYVRSVDGPDGVNDTDAARYSHLMQVTQDLVIDCLLESYDFSRHRALADIGGGSGRFVDALAERHAKIDLHVLDLPPVADQARKSLASCGREHRITVHGGSFFEDDIPRHADCYSLLRVLYDHDDAAATLILANIRAAMKPGDTLVIAEPMDGDNAGERHAAAYFHIYLLAMRSGRCRSAQEHFALLEKAGFTKMRKIRTHLPVATGLIVAKV